MDKNITKEFEAIFDEWHDPEKSELRKLKKRREKLTEDNKKDLGYE